MKQSHAAMANAKGGDSCQEKKIIKQTPTIPTTADSPKPIPSAFAGGNLLPYSSRSVVTSMKKESGLAPLEGVMAMIQNQQSRAIRNRLAFAGTTNDKSIIMPVKTTMLFCPADSVTSSFPPECTSIIMPVKATMPFFPADSVTSSFPPESSLLGNRLSYLRTSLLHQQVAAQKHQRLVTALRTHHHEMAIMSILQSVRRDFSAGSIS